jgi:hypothetical protein
MTAAWRNGIHLICLTGTIATAGCSGRDASMPPTYPVTGSVLTANGKLYEGGSLQFRPEKNEEFTVTGDIEKDGTFRLRTLRGNTRADGAPAGAYQVTISASHGPDRKPKFATFTAPQKYTVEPNENKLEIRADPPE